MEGGRGVRIIKAGNKDVIEWWIGKQVTCANCGQVMEFERGDLDLATTLISSESASVFCDCGERVRVERENV